MKRYFGTDGIRGRVGQPPMTPEFILKLGWAAGRVLARGKPGKVIIGKDTRISGYLFESALESGLSAAGMDILLLGPMPTPGIAYLTRTLRAQAGIVISASHNPYDDNGIKFFSQKGFKLPDAVEAAIEQALDAPMVVADSPCLGKAERVTDAPGRYIEYCKSAFPHHLDLRGVRVAVDCAHGATYHIAPSVFEELGAQVIPIGVSPDGLNINKDCGSTHPRALQEAVLAHRAHLGVALDGDGDRLIMVDGRGEVVDGDEILFIIARARKLRNDLSGVVGTVMSNLGLEQALENMGIPFIRAPVGDRHVLEALMSHGWVLGGETSGHILCMDRTTTGDGIIAALQVLAEMVESGRDLHDLKRGMAKYPQTLISVPLRRRDVVDHPAVHAALREAKGRLGDRGRVVLRPSGTEPVVRIMVEGEDRGLVEPLANALGKVLQEV